MKLSYTPDDLVRYLYNEVTPEEKLTMNQTMEYDFNLRERFQELKDSQLALECELLSPGRATIAGIMRYSSESALETSC